MRVYTKKEEGLKGNLRFPLHKYIFILVLHFVIVTTPQKNLHMALKTASKTVTKSSVSNSFREKLLRNTSLRIVYRNKETDAAAIKESSEEVCHHLDTMVVAALCRLESLRKKLAKAPDPVSVAVDDYHNLTASIEATQQDHQKLTSMLETATKIKAQAESRLQETKEQYAAAVKEFHQLRAQWDHELLRDFDHAEMNNISQLIKNE